MTTQFSRWGFALMFVVVCSSAVVNGQTETRWIGGDSNWSLLSNWTNGIPSSTGPLNTIIDQDLGTDAVVREAFGVVRNLFVDTGDRVELSRFNFLVVDGDVTNNGSIYSPDVSSASGLAFRGQSASLSGLGTLSLGDESGSYLVAQNDIGDSFILYSQNNIEGAGRIGDDLSSSFTDNLNLENHGNVIANIAGRELSFERVRSGDLILNRWTMSAQEGGILTFNNSTVDNADGLIFATSESTVNIFPDYDPTFAFFIPRLTGGCLEADAGSTFLLNGIFENVELIGEFSARTLTLAEDIHNSGIIRVDNQLFTRDIGLAGDVTLTGGGELDLQDFALFEDYADSFVNVDNRITGYGGFWADTIDFRPASVISPNGTRGFPEAAGELFLYCNDILPVTLGGKIELDLRTPGDDRALVNQAVNELDFVRVYGNALLDGPVEVRFFDDAPMQLGDFYDLVSAVEIDLGPSFDFIVPEGFGIHYEVVEAVLHNSTFKVLRVTLTDVPTSEIVVPGSVSLERGRFVAGGVVELNTSDNLDYSATRRLNDFQPIVSLIATATSANLNPNAMTLTVEGAVFARAQVELQVSAFNYESDAFEIVHVAAAQRFVDRVDQIPMSGNLARFIDPLSGQMQTRVRYVSSSNRQVFAANVDQVIWTLVE